MASSCPGRGIGGWQWADMPLAMMMMMMNNLLGDLFTVFSQFDPLGRCSTRT